MSQLLSFLDIRNTKSLSLRFMRNMEKSIGNDLRKVATDSMLQGIEEEVRLTLNNENKFNTYKQNVMNKTQGSPIAITISFNMGWSRHASGNRYDFLSGYALAIGVLSKSIPVAIVSSKLCCVCSLADAVNEEPPNH